MSLLNTNEIKLYYEIYGSGYPLILLSGLATDSQSWVSCLNSLSKKYMVIAIDNRGCGRTTPQESTTNIPLMAADIIALLDHLSVKRGNVVGNSMGGFIALELAINYPEYVNKLVLEASASKNTEENNKLFHKWAENLWGGGDMREWYRESFKWLFHHKIFDNQKRLEAKLTYAANYPYKQSAAAFKNQLEAVENFDVTASLYKIKTPTLILCGKEDLLFPVEYIKTSLEGIPNSKTIIVENAAHAIHVDMPQDFIRHVDEFLAI